MIYISDSPDHNGVINLTVGDDASIEINITTDDGAPYTMGDNEYLIFNVREKADEDSPLLINLESALGSKEIVFSHDDTKDLSPGYYSAEVQFMGEDGKRITIWPKLEGNAKISKANRKNFCLMSEVVYE